MKLYKEEIDSLKQIVNDVFLVDICANNRRRDVVDARHIYSKILREKGYGYESIGSSIKKNHATIVHYIKNIDSILTYDKQLRDKYMTCKILFYKDREAITNELRKDVDIYMTVIRLRGELHKAISDKNNVINNFMNYIEEYEKLRGHLPSIDDYRSTILPKFDV
jgi:hypothetical protein